MIFVEFLPTSKKFRLRMCVYTRDEKNQKLGVGRNDDDGQLCQGAVIKI